MVIVHLQKRKVRPVLDFKELNQLVTASDVTADACEDKIRDWRKLPENCFLLDLPKAYMQLHVHHDCSMTA